MEARADLPCLLDKNNVLETPISNTNIAIKHTVTVFDSPTISEDEEVGKTEQESTKKKKFVFVSPFERYKRVIPMIAEQEAQEREKQKQEEENRLKKEIEIVESKNRVYQHFKQVSQMITGKNESELSKKPSQTPLSQMPGRKRKRDSNINKQDEVQEEKTNDNLSTPVPILETRIIQDLKKDVSEVEYLKEEQNVQESVTKKQKQIPNNETMNLLRSRKKGERERTIKDLEKKGMMPSKKFDYKIVDFSAFQGGSQNIPNQVQFEQTMKKKKQKNRKKKKQKKLNI
ncbi:exosome component 10 [Apis mellifera carnica]|nr:exosome component 10 [Apis mellifera carnica]